MTDPYDELMRPSPLLDRMRAAGVTFRLDANREPAEPLGWSTNQDGNVVITMTRDDYDSLLLQLGYAAGCAGRNDDPVFHRNNILLLNRLNAGNPNYTMYRVEPEGKIGK